MLKSAVVCLFSCCLLTACEKNIETARYNVYFWFPDNSKENYLGEVDGLSACGSIAHGYAYSKNLNRNDGWSYICCMKTSSSECAEKHR